MSLFPFLTISLSHYTSSCLHAYVVKQPALLINCSCHITHISQLHDTCSPAALNRFFLLRLICKCFVLKLKPRTLFSFRRDVISRQRRLTATVDLTFCLYLLYLDHTFGKAFLFFFPYPMAVCGK